MATYKPAPAGQSNGRVEQLKAGEYPAQIVQVKVKFSKCGQFEQHGLRVRVEDAGADLWEDFWENLTFSDNAMWKVEHVLSAVGLEVGVECEIAPEDWVERRGRVEIGPKDGKMQIKRWIKPARRVAPAKKPPGTYERLKAMAVPSGEDGLPF